MSMDISPFNDTYDSKLKFKLSINAVDVLDLLYFKDKVKFDTLCTWSHCTFSGYIDLNGFIVFDYMILNKKYLWNKKIKYDRLRYNLPLHQRVLFDIKLKQEVFNDVYQLLLNSSLFEKSPSCIVDFEQMKVVNVRTPKINSCIFVNPQAMDVLANDFLYRCITYYDIYIPNDIKKLIKLFVYGIIFKKDQQFVPYVPENNTNNNIITSEFGIKNDMNKRFSVNFKILKAQSPWAFFTVGISYHILSPQCNLNLSVLFGEFDNGDILKLLVQFKNNKCTMKLFNKTKRKLIGKLTNEYIFPNATLYPYVSWNMDFVFDNDFASFSKLEIKPNDVGICHNIRPIANGNDLTTTKTIIKQIDVDSAHDFVEEYNWKCLHTTKNKYLSQQIGKKFKNKCRKNKLNARKHIRKNRCKICQVKLSQKRSKKKLNGLKKKQLGNCRCIRKNKNGKKCNNKQQSFKELDEIYDYQQLYDELIMLDEYDYEQEQERETCFINVKVDTTMNDSKPNFKLTLKRTDLKDKVTFNTLCTWWHCGPFSGYIDTNGFIVLDDMVLNKKWLWNKQIKYDKLQYNVCEYQRVLFDMKLKHNVFNKVYESFLYSSFVEKTPSIILNFEQMRAVNLRSPEMECFIFPNQKKIDMLVNGFVSICMKHYGIYIPNVIIQLIIVIGYGIQYQQTQWKVYSSAEYSINSSHITHEIPAKTHNIIISDVGMKNDMNKSFNFFFKILKKPISGYLTIGILSHPQNIIDHLNKYKNKNRWWNNDLESKYIEIEKNNISLQNNGQILKLLIKFEDNNCEIQLFNETNCELIGKNNKQVVFNEIFYAYVAVGYAKGNELVELDIGDLLPNMKI